MGYATFKSDTAFFTFTGSFSKPNSGAWTPITTSPASLYFAAQAFMYGSSRRLLMHEYVQKLTSTTLPRSDLLLNGAEFSQSVTPSRSGIRPSSPGPDAIATTAEIRAAAPIQNASFFITKTPTPRGDRQSLPRGSRQVARDPGPCLQNSTDLPP